MKKIKIKNIKLDDLKTIITLLSQSTTREVDIHDLEFVCVNAVLTGMYLRLQKQIFGAMHDKKFNVNMNLAEASAFVVFIDDVEWNNVHTNTLLNQIKDQIIKQLV